MNPDGSYVRISPNGQPEVSVQDYFINQARSPAVRSENTPGPQNPAA